MTTEALTTRLNHEILAALKKFIPLRDSIREKLQRRQEVQTDFTPGSEQLFSPITSATKDVKTAAECAIWGEISDLEKDPTRPPRKETPLLGVLEKIVAETEKTQQGIQQLSGDLKTQREIGQLGGIDIDDFIPPPPEFADEPEKDKPQTRCFFYR